MIFDYRGQDHADPRKPKGFKLPQIECMRRAKEVAFSKVKGGVVVQIGLEQLFLEY